MEEGSQTNTKHHKIEKKSRRGGGVAVAAACKDSVRRWRLLKVGQRLPGLIPDSCDVGAPDCSNTILIDISLAMQPYIHGVGVGAHERDGWQPAWRHSLLSAADG